jgi:hypothetical protein
VFRLIRCLFKLILLLKLIGIAFSLAVVLAVGLRLRAQYRVWGLVEGAATRHLPGDELVEPAGASETRGLEIDAPPSAVWPWLLQLGYGRGGWYGFGALDRAWSPAGGGAPGRSADSIIAEFQELAEGDLVPTHPGGGFVVRELQPAAALVLYLDAAMMREQMEELAAEATAEASKAMRNMDMPPFAVSWAFVLEPLPGGRTRLIERLRFRIDDLSAAQRRALPMLSLGVFALMRSQLEGIRRRVERAAWAASRGG